MAHGRGGHRGPRAAVPEDPLERVRPRLRGVRGHEPAGPPVLHRVDEPAHAVGQHRGAARLRLEVRADNGAGIRLYERRGYTRFAAIPDYYEDGMEAWRYEKLLET